MRFWFNKGAWVSRGARRKIARLVPDAIQRIAVIRHAALGDLVLTRPFLLELRRHFPRATVTLSLVSNYVHGAPCDLVDRVHIAYGNDRKDVPLREQVRRARELGEQDLLFDLAATTRSFWLCAFNRAALKIGFPYRPFQRRLFYDAAILRSDFKFEAETLLDMLHLLGLRTEYPLRFDMPGKPLRRERPYIVYFLSASTPYKSWPVERFAELIQRNSQGYPLLDHLVLEGRDAWESKESMMAPLAKSRNIAVLKGMGLEETIALLKEARLLVSNDTGIRNLAIATNTPTVGIFFATPPYRYWPRFSSHEAVFNSDGTPPSVDQVAHAVDAVLPTVVTDPSAAITPVP